MKYFLADLHLHHPKLAALRGFDSVEEHDAAIMEGIHALSPDDQLWVLGDICSGGKESMLNALGKLVLVKTPMYLISGNHDQVHPLHRDCYKYWAEFTGVFQGIFPFARTAFAGRRLFMSHFPYVGQGDHTSEERFTQYRLHNEGGYLIHGHTHSSELRSGPRSVCVSAEATGLKPISEVGIAEVLGF